jgi:hypothetical protein
MIVAVDLRDRGHVTVVGAGRYTDGSRIVQVVTPGESPRADGWGVTYRTFGRGVECIMLLMLPR